MSVFPLGNKNSLYTYLVTSQRDAGEYLEEKPDAALLQRAETNGRIKAEMRPTIINYTDNRTIWDWSSHTTHLTRLAASASRTTEENLTPAEKKRKDEE